MSEPSSTYLQRTPLYERHLAQGGKLVPFAGWELPVQYTGVIAEHQAVRNAVGIFDVSHMGEIVVRGPQALSALQHMTCNDLSLLTDGKAQYNAILNEAGGVVDDIIVYRFAADTYFVCVNASNAEKDFAWFTRHNTFDCVFENKSAAYGQVALQGPKAVALAAAANPELLEVEPFHFREVNLFDAGVIAARTGYTGEDGFEFFIPCAQTVTVWDGLINAGAVPAGLGARDSLRLEACYPLHGNELAEDVTALESGLAWIVKLQKGDFIGRAALEAQTSAGAPRQLIGFFVEDSGIARHGDRVFDSSGAEIGLVTSGTKTPTLQKALGMARVTRAHAKLGTEIFIEVRGKRLKSRVVKKPFYKRG